MKGRGVKLSTGAATHGLARQSAWRLYRAGQPPCLAGQLPTGPILVYPPARLDTQVARYARVASPDPKAGLERLRALTAGRPRAVSAACPERGSGLNGRRQKPLAWLRDQSIAAIVVEHGDRPARLGAEYSEAPVPYAGKSLVVAGETEKTADLVPDCIDGAISLRARLDGKRSAKNRAARAL